jgi:peptidoglycan LD-endopeptidase CwlK
MPMNGRDNDLEHLHPTVRERVKAVLAKLAAENIPFRVFESFRSPQRQQYLWEQGRTRPGHVVTRARPWQSMHQYGLAADFVLFENGNWSWDDHGDKARWWNRMDEVGRQEGLEPLSFERPHLQLPGLSLAELGSGHYPPGGDSSWTENLAAAVFSWTGSPSAPPVPAGHPERPPLAPDAVVTAPPADLPAPAAADWHSQFGGQEWRYDATGVYLRDNAQPLRSGGEPLTCRAIWHSFADEMIGASRRHGVAVALIMMTIAAETAVYRRYGFSGPMTFRWEPGAKINDVSPPRSGDYSAGPMQPLAGSARWIVRAQHLNYDPFAVAPAYERRPEPPLAHPLYEAAANIDIGTAAIKQRWGVTGDDPILVAAAYNAGGLYKIGANKWHLRTAGNHLDRAAQWFGDACAVLKEARG